MVMAIVLVEVMVMVIVLVKVMVMVIVLVKVMAMVIVLLKGTAMVIVLVQVVVRAGGDGDGDSHSFGHDDGGGWTVMVMELAAGGWLWRMIGMVHCGWTMVIRVSLSGYWDNWLWQIIILLQLDADGERLNGELVIEDSFGR